MATKAITHTQRYGTVSFYGNLSSFTTTVNTYVSVDQIPVTTVKTKVFVFTGTTNTVSVKIMGNYDGTTTCATEVVAEFDVAAGATVVKTTTNLYANFEVVVKPKVNDTHGTLDTVLFCTSL